MSKPSRVCDTYHQLETWLGVILTTAEYPVRVSFEKAEPHLSYHKLKRLCAMLYDIVRFRENTMTPSKSGYEREVARWKATDVWPRYSDPEPNPMTGEVMYLPKSRADLTPKEYQGICQWLEHYMTSNGIPSHAPADNWQIPTEGAA
jgi:hypothetical protein